MNISALIRTPKIFPAIISVFVLAQPAHAAEPGDEHWDNQFGPVGAKDLLFAVTQYRSNIYSPAITRPQATPKRTSSPALTGPTGFR